MNVLCHYCLLCLIFNLEHISCDVYMTLENTPKQMMFRIGPASHTMLQHYAIIRSMSRRF